MSAERTFDYRPRLDERNRAYRVAPDDEDLMSIRDVRARAPIGRAL